MKPSRGLTVVEVLVSLLILSFIVTTSLAIFFDRHARLERAGHVVRAYQALANEAEVIRHVPYIDLEAGESRTFQSGRDVLYGFEDLETLVNIQETSTGLKEVLLTVRWNRGKESAMLTVLRTDTGGDELW